MHERLCYRKAHISNSKTNAFVNAADRVLALGAEVEISQQAMPSEDNNSSSKGEDSNNIDTDVKEDGPVSSPRMGRVPSIG
jgi:hypothetical protein